MAENTDKNKSRERSSLVTTDDVVSAEVTSDEEQNDGFKAVPLNEEEVDSSNNGDTDHRPDIYVAPGA